MLVIHEWQNQNDSSRDADQNALNDHLTELEVNQVKLEEVLGTYYSHPLLRVVGSPVNMCQTCIMLTWLP